MLQSFIVRSFWKLGAHYFCKQSRPRFYSETNSITESDLASSPGPSHPEKQGCSSDGKLSRDLGTHMIQQSAVPYLHRVNSIVHHPLCWGLANCRMACASVAPRANAVMHGFGMTLCVQIYKMASYTTGSSCSRRGRNVSHSAFQNWSLSIHACVYVDAM